MGHNIRKIEIVGSVWDKLILKHIHSTPEKPKETSSMKNMKLTPSTGCLNDMEKISI